MKPTDQCWSAVTYLLRYLKGTTTCGIHYENGDLTLFGYSDSSWADDLYSRRSTAGYVFVLNNDPISWSSKRQATVSTSTCEAEYILQTETACEAVWMYFVKNLVLFLGKEACRYYKTMDDLLDTKPPEEVMFRLNWDPCVLEAPHYQRDDGAIDSARVFSQRSQNLSFCASYV